jgi:hypothetical protein
MNKFILTLLSSPILIGCILSVGVMFNPAQATKPSPNNPDKLSCVRNKHVVGLVCARASTLAKISTQVPKADSSSNDAPMLEFNEQESDVAIAYFGCDCPACINSLRQMRGIEPLVY